MNKKGLFEENATKTLDRISKVYEERAGQYADSYRADTHLTLQAVLEKIGVGVPDRWLNAITAAVLYDVKYSRLEGGYKEDNIVDGINYGAFLVEELAQIEKELEGYTPEKE